MASSISATTAVLSPTGHNINLSHLSCGDSKTSKSSLSSEQQPQRSSLTKVVAVSSPKVAENSIRKSIFHRLERIGHACSLPSEYWSTETDPFKLRSKTYLKDKKKCVSEESMFQLLAIDFIELDEHARDVAKTLKGGVAQKYLSQASAAGPQPFLFIVNFMLPGSDKNLSFIAYFAAKPGVLETASPSSNLFHQFISGSDEFRQSRFKFIPTVSKGPFLVRSMVGSTPAILGNKLTQTYFLGEGYFEVCVDVGSSAVGASALKLVKGYLTSLTFDMAFVLEAQNEEELPETCLGTLRFSNLDLKMSKKFVPSTDQE